MLFYVTLCYFMFILCYFMLFYVILCYLIMLFYVILLCYFMLFYVILCYFMLFYVTYVIFLPSRGNGEVLLPFGSAEYVGLGFSVFAMLVRQTVRRRLNYSRKGREIRARAR